MGIDDAGAVYVSGFTDSTDYDTVGEIEGDDVSGDLFISKIELTATPPPDTTITSGPAEGSTTSDETPTFAFTSSPAGATFECSIDSGVFTSCASPFTTPALSEAAHSFAVRAVGPGGTDATPATRGFTVALDNQACEDAQDALDTAEKKLEKAEKKLKKAKKNGSKKDVKKAKKKVKKAEQAVEDAQAEVEANC